MLHDANTAFVNNDTTVARGTMAQVLIARSLERIADQSTNICEEIIYLIKGDDIRHEQPAG